jgi:hypothetical protein
MTGTGRRRWGWNPLIADEPDQAARMQQFRAEHPEVIIEPAGFGTVQARVPEPSGESVVTRYTVRELLDVLDEYFATPDTG